MAGRDQRDSADPNPPPIVEVTEDSKTVRALLDTCYPFQNPDLSSLDAVDSLLDAAVKYDVAKALDLCKRELQGFVTSEPLRVYAIACRLNYETLAKAAADYTRSQEIFRDGLVYAKELDRVSGGCYHRLLQNYRQRETPQFCTPSAPDKKPIILPSPLRDTLVAPSPFDSPDANCIIIASDGIIFHADMAFISSVAPGLAARLVPTAAASEPHVDLTGEVDSVCDAGGGQVKRRGSQTVSAAVEESSEHLLLLLQLCHPACSPNVSSMELGTVASLVNIAQKYMMEKAVWLLRLVLPRCTPREPFRVYVLTSIWGWPEEAREAADILLGKTFDELETLYATEMEDMEPKWLFASLGLAIKLLANRPSPDTILTGVGFAELMRTIHNEAQCSSCRSAYPKHVSAIDLIASKVKDLIANDLLQGMCGHGCLVLDSRGLFDDPRTSTAIVQTKPVSYYAVANVLGEHYLGELLSPVDDSIEGDETTTYPPPPASDPPLRLRAPYDRLDGDVILRCSDNVGFRVHRLILVLASPVFADMFSLPQPATAESESAVSPPTIDLTEDSKTILPLLDACYPFGDPTLDDLDTIDRVLDAAAKYDVAKATQFSQRRLHAFVSWEPLRAFAIACRMHFEDLAKAAADRVHALSIFENGLVYVKELDRTAGEMETYPILPS
ncbi:hypothetical protein FOMPIDRAFT_112740 [Fomitopsis schrenkii]|uniref:BTB domain-containing protein n=1 Tax=Fomitopsis schrenkii TaxID=2126942 RepID=S8FP39_FOMSC|nr:hypothetical protein FOMPIDRAFT_112740 [Fomitopsis schrenkii]